MPRNMFQSGFVSIADLYLAYRKAKSEAYYDNLHPSALIFSKFEQNLQRNLENLHKKIIKGDKKWWQDSEFIGDYLYIPKSVSDMAWSESVDVHYRSVDPSHDWEQRFKESGKKRLDAKYRLIMVPTVEYQVLSALWILKVGHKFEEKLDKNLSYANRLRRRNSKFSQLSGTNGTLNEDSSGLFSPYFSAYQNWRNKGLDAMRELVEEGKSVTAITMDLAGFYHNVSPDFLLKPSFLKKISLKLDDNEKKLSQLLLESIECWYRKTPDYLERPQGALPVGLSASKVISNILLYELDTDANELLEPSYYGRYVDDIFLVLETPDGVSNGNEVIDYLSKHINSLKINRVKGHLPELRLKFNYASDSDLRFTADKQKIFHLSSEHGLDLIDQIASQIRAQSSEYRMLPELPDSSMKMAEKALLATPDASLIADALRKADVVSVRRLGLSLLVRDIESYSTDLSRSDWVDLRSEFYGLVHRYLLTPKGLFELYGYYQRVFSLMVANHDFDDAKKFINNLSSCFELVEKTTISVKGRKERIVRCKAYFEKSLLQVALQATTTKNFTQWPKLRELLKIIFLFSDASKIDLRKSYLSKLSKNLLLADLGSRPYKDYWYYSQNENIDIVKVPLSREVRLITRLASIKRFRKNTHLKTPHWPALVFPTRPLTIQEIALVNPSVLDNAALFRHSIFGLRGAKTSWSDNIGRNIMDGNGCYVSVPNKNKEKVYIALTNLETTDIQFEGAIKGKPDRSLTRYEKINKLINNILRSNQRSDYVVFPECSIPRRWAMSISGKLARQNISLIAGIEYYEHKKGLNILRNDCLVSLATKWPGYYSNFVFLQPKLLPSHKEAAKLRKAGKKLYKPKSSNEILPIFVHGNYHIGVLICSDLTNPENRVRFQGKVDSLFVLEWNPDVKTFSYLIEGAAHDIHTFVIQVNNRLYGDSRVRAPYRIEHMRDSVRLKGGVEDYFVIAEVDFQSLRSFQQKNRMNDKKSEFKPVPIGFKMSSMRKK